MGGWGGSGAWVIWWENGYNTGPAGVSAVVPLVYCSDSSTSQYTVES